MQQSGSLEIVRRWSWIFHSALTLTVVLLVASSSVGDSVGRIAGVHWMSTLGGNLLRHAGFGVDLKQ